MTEPTQENLTKYTPEELIKHFDTLFAEAQSRIAPPRNPALTRRADIQMLVLLSGGLQERVDEYERTETAIRASVSTALGEEPEGDLFDVVEALVDAYALLKAGQ
jgi:hypothetical protein